MDKKILIILIVILLVVGIIYFWPKAAAPVSELNTQTGNELSNTSIIIQNFSFNPSELNVAKGTTVTWVNQDSVPHKIHSDMFQSDVLNRGQSFSFTFDNIGSFDYNCSIHPSMKGKVIVK